MYQEITHSTWWRYCKCCPWKVNNIDMNARTYMWCDKSEGEQQKNTTSSVKSGTTTKKRNGTKTGLLVPWQKLKLKWQKFLKSTSTPVPDQNLGRGVVGHLNSKCLRHWFLCIHFNAPQFSSSRYAGTLSLDLRNRVCLQISGLPLTLRCVDKLLYFNVFFLWQTQSTALLGDIKLLDGRSHVCQAKWLFPSVFPGEISRPKHSFRDH